MKKFYVVTRDLHLYLGLFLCPFVLVFAISVFFLVHAFAPGLGPPVTRVVSSLPQRAGLESLSGRERIEALRPVLAAARVAGEVGFIQYHPRQHSLVIPLSVPGRETVVSLDLATRTATIEERRTGVWDALITLHKLPGPHLANIRGNWFWIRLWRLLADATVYLLLFLTLSGVYLWYAIRGERAIGLALLVCGAASFLGILYALCHN